MRCRGIVCCRSKQTLGAPGFGAGFRTRDSALRLTAAAASTEPPWHCYSSGRVGSREASELHETRGRWKADGWQTEGRRRAHGWQMAGRRMAEGRGQTADRWLKEAGQDSCSTAACPSCTLAEWLTTRAMLQCVKTTFGRHLPRQNGGQLTTSLASSVYALPRHPCSLHPLFLFTIPVACYAWGSAASVAWVCSSTKNSSVPRPSTASLSRQLPLLRPSTALLYPHPLALSSSFASFSRCYSVAVRTQSLICVLPCHVWSRLI